jgi:hypothetical protein
MSVETPEMMKADNQMQCVLEGPEYRGEGMEGGTGGFMASHEVKKLIASHLFVLGGLRLGPGSDISRTASSRGENFWLGVGTA